MKIRFLIAAWALGTMGYLVSSCANPAQASPNGPSVVVPPGKGAITVSIPSAKAKALDIGFAEANSNYFEVVAWEQTGDNTAGDRYWMVLDSGSTSGTLNGVNPGTYRVVVVAGLKVLNGGAGFPPEATLLGAGQVTGVVVGSGTNTQVPVTLTNSTFAFTSIADTDAVTPGNQVAVGQTFQITVAGNTGVPVVVPASMGAWNTAGTYLTGVGGQSWSATMSFVAPAAVGTQDYYFAYGGGRISFFDLTNGINLGTTSAFDANSDADPVWRLPSSQQAAWAPLEAQVPGKATVSFFSPGLAVDVTWGSGQ